jgi:TonB family protein
LFDKLKDDKFAFLILKTETLTEFLSQSQRKDQFVIFRILKSDCKKINMKKLLITIILLSAGIVHAQTDEKETLRQLSQNALSAYQNQKLDDAIKFAQQAVDLSLKIYGAKHVETAVAYTNLGVIYRDKKKFKESVENLQRAVEVYESLSNLKSYELTATYEALALSQLSGGLKAEAEANYLKAIAVTESKHGKDSKESFLPTLNLANFYAHSKNFEKADEIYLKSYALAIKNFGREAEQLKQIEDSRTCLIGQSFNIERDKMFSESRQKLFGENVAKNGAASINGGIINGKAKSLPKPYYPKEAKAERLGGAVSVRVIVDEQGNVTEAKSICGHPILGKTSEEAARKSKFPPTTLSGKPVKVYGILIYYYIP